MEEREVCTTHLLIRGSSLAEVPNNGEERGKTRQPEL